MRTLTSLLVSVFLTACLPSDDGSLASDRDFLEGVRPQQPAPRAPIRDSVAEALYQRVWSAVDPGDGYRDFRYLEFDWVMWNGVEVLRRSHRYSPWEENFRVATNVGGQELVAVGNWNNPSMTRVWMDGEEITGDSAVFLSRRAERMFELDANALLLPFRWADLGVHTEHRGEVTTEDGRSAEAVELTFQSDGSGSEPRYMFWVDTSTDLPLRSFRFRHEADTEPNSVTDWLDWTSFGPIVLSTRRTTGGASEIRFENIRVEDTLPEGRFRGPVND
jgi:hypothetical protein